MQPPHNLRKSQIKSTHVIQSRFKSNCDLHLPITAAYHNQFLPRPRILLSGKVSLKSVRVSYAST